MDDEQLEFVSSIFMHSEKSTGKELSNTPTPVTSGKVEIDEDAAIMESKISQIRDLFPDYGKGFLAACLEAYSQNPEEVIQRILEGTLHQDLQALDISLEVMPTSKTALTVGRNDKGKGKLVESVPVSSNNSVAGGRVQQSERPSVSSSSPMGRFVRKSKGDVPDSNTLDDKNEKDSARTAALLSQYEYEDEYDDSFDDLGLSVAESRFEENEILGDKIRSGKSWEKESESSSQNPSDSSKWGSRKKPQYYVKDGKNYSYKVEGSVAVANASEASLVTLAQKEFIYGLGRGGNLPLGAVKQLMEATEDQDKQQQAVPETDGRRFGNQRGRGRRGGGGDRQRDSNEDQDKQSGAAEGEGRENAGNYRGRGGRRGGGRNHNRKDRAVAKHFSRLGGY